LLDAHGLSFLGIGFMYAVKDKNVSLPNDQLQRVTNEFQAIRVKSGVDARLLHINQDLQTLWGRKTHIWFQCPYILQADVINFGTTAKLIVDFFDSARQVQKAHSWIFLGISVKARVVYDLFSLINSSSGAWIGPGKDSYNYRGWNRFAMHQLLENGYVHQGRPDKPLYHSMVMDDDLLILCFERTDASCTI
jgi:hypothetical protein